MDTSIFKYGELPEFKKFTPERINQEFPIVIKKINIDFENIENSLSNFFKQNYFINTIFLVCTNSPA